MKLSQFISTGIKKKVKYVDGIAEIVTENNPLNGEFSLYEMDIERLNLINDNIVKKYEVSNLNNDEFILLVMPYLCDVEVDVTKEQFMEMLENPTPAFTFFINMIMDFIQDVIVYGNNISEITEKGKKIEENINSVPVETVEQKLERLYKELSEEISKEKRIQLLKEIQVLEAV